MQGRETCSDEARNRPTQIIQDGVVTMTNSYRPDGMRHKKVTPTATQQMVWDRSDVRAWADATGALGQFFTRGADTVKSYSPSQQLFYHCNAIGTIQAYSLPSGATQVRAILDAWGANPAGTDVCSYVGDRGYWEESGLNRPLYYVRARWLVAGRPGWLSADPLRLALRVASLYRYARNSPVVFTDPSGLQEAQQDVCCCCVDALPQPTPREATIADLPGYEQLPQDVLASAPIAVMGHVLPFSVTLATGGSP